MTLSELKTKISSRMEDLESNGRVSEMNGLAYAYYLLNEVKRITPVGVSPCEVCKYGPPRPCTVCEDCPAERKKDGNN